jgi:hypothetical protein
MEGLSFHAMAVGPDECGDEDRGGIVPMARAIVAIWTSQMGTSPIIAIV